MARIFGLNGVVRGRQGNNVFSVQNGIQVLKQYQPVVYNPRTQGQREQRAKFALAGKMSAATPSAALIGMRGGSPRARRAMFVSLLSRGATTSLDSTGVVATVPFENIMFSQGSVPIYSNMPTIAAVWSGTTGRENVRVTISAMATPSITPVGYGERYVIALFDGITFNLEEVRTGLRSSSSQVDVLFRIGARRDLRVAVYSVPFVSNDTELRFNTSNLYDTENAVNILGALSDGAATLSFGNSVLLSVVPVIGAQTNMMPSDDVREVVEEALLDTAVTSKEK